MFQHFGIWTPLFLIWLGVSTFDSDMMRQIFKWLVEFSVLLPFGGYWLALIYLFDTATEMKFWGSWELWVAVPIWLAYTGTSMIVQVGLVPKILNWIDTTPITEGDGKTREERKEERQAAKQARKDAKNAANAEADAANAEADAADEEADNADDTADVDPEEPAADF